MIIINIILSALTIAYPIYILHLALSRDYCNFTKWQKNLICPLITVFIYAPLCFLFFTKTLEIKNKEIILLATGAPYIIIWAIILHKITMNNNNE